MHQNLHIPDHHRREAILQARLTLSEFALTHSLADLLQKTLDEAERLTGSQIGFFHFVDTNQSTIRAQMWSTNTLRRMCTADRRVLHSDRETAGVWTDCLHQRRPVIHNNYKHLPHRKGLPEGHAPVVRELVVPVMRGDLVMAILGVGNKREDYTSADVEMVSLLADLAWDITERKRSEEALQNILQETRASEERMTAVLSSVSDGLLALDSDGWVTLMNPSAERLLRTEPGEGVGRPAREVIQNHELLCCCLEFLATSKESDIKEIALFDNELEENRDIQVRLTGLPAASGGRGGLAAVLLDVTREREIDRMKSEFVTTAAHELRTPLTVILGYAELLLEAEQNGIFPPAERLEFIHQIIEKGDVLTQIVNDFLDLDRIENSRPIHLETTSCDISHLVPSAVDLYRRETDLHHFEVTGFSRPMHVFIDKTRMSQVLDNILTNAVKYSPEGGTIYVTGKKLNNEIEISIRDEGIGMTDEEIARVFEKFYRANTSATAIGGIGLGMCVTKGIVEAHGGRIWVESKPQEGTLVTFTLPLSSQDIEHETI